MEDYFEPIYPLHMTCKKGCIQLTEYPNLDLFKDCFSEGISMSDVDGTVEHNSHILWMEWKKSGVDLESFDRHFSAQIRQAKAFTRNSHKQTFVFVIGDPVCINGEMSIRLIRFIRNGEWDGGWTPCNFTEFKWRLRHWYAAARAADHYAKENYPHLFSA